MNAKKWIKIWFIFIMIIPLTGLFNYYIDPYGYHSKNDKFIEDLTRVNKPFVLNNKLYCDTDIYIIGTSRQMRVNPQLIEKYSNKVVQNINISGSTLSENLMLAKKVNSLDKNFIYSFDCFSLNKYRVDNFGHISNRYHTYQHELEKKSNILSSYINKDLVTLSYTNVLNRLKGHKYNQIEIDENTKVAEYNETKIINEFNDVEEKGDYKKFTLYEDDTIVELAKIATKNDIFIIYPKYLFYYKMFQQYQDIESKYFHAIRLLVNNTKAEVWSYYGVNRITVDKNNFDKNGWHFKPKIAKDIYAEVYNTKAETIGQKLTKENLESYLVQKHNEVKEYFQ